MSYEPKVYMKHGVAELHAADTGKIRLDGAAVFETETGAVTLSSNAGTLSQLAGIITTVIATMIGGSNSQGVPIVSKTVAGAGSFVITVTNAHASAALNGTLILGFFVVSQAT